MNIFDIKKYKKRLVIVDPEYDQTILDFEDTTWIFQLLNDMTYEQQQEFHEWSNELVSSFAKRK